MRKFFVAMCTCLGFAMAGSMLACSPTDSVESSIQPESPVLEFTTVPEDITVFATTEVTIPEVEYVEGVELLISVNAPSGAAVTVIDGKFIAETEGDYIITYTLKSGEDSKTETVTVTAVLPTTKPVLTVEEGTPERILVNESFTLKSATAIDALNGACSVTVKVTAPNGEDVTITDNAFTPTLRGEYTITYTATDAFNNSDSKTITIEAYAVPQAITPVEGGVKNSFETEEASFLEKLNQETAGVEFSRIDTLDNLNEVRSGAYSLKVSMSKGGTFNLLSEVITGSKSLADVGTLSFWVYNASEAKCGFSIYGVTLTNSQSQKTEVYKALEVGAWTKYELNFVENCGFTAEELKDTYALSMWTEKGGVFYIDDISWDNRSDYAEVSGVEATASADWNVEYTIPTATVSDGTTLTVSVTAPDGSAVDVAENKFTTSQGGTYVITYTGTKGEHTVVKKTELTVVRPAPTPVAPVDASVKNSFETEEDCYLDTLGATFSRNDTYMNANAVHSGAYSLKLKVEASGTCTIYPQVFTDSKSLAEIGKLSFWVYNANDSEIGFSFYKIITTNNAVSEPNVYKKLSVGEWTKYEINFVDSVTLTAEQLADVWGIQFHIGGAGTFYIDDIAWDNRSDYAEVSGVEATASADWNVEYTIPTATVSDGTTLTVSVTAPDGSAVDVVENKFTTSQGGTYVITYTGTKGEHTVVKKTELTVVRPAPTPVAPVDASVKNSFETEEECYIGVTNGLNANFFSHNDTYMNADGVRSGAYSLKLNATKVDNYWFRPQVVTGTTSLAEVGTLSFWVYNANDTAIGFSLYTIIAGTTNQTVNVYASIPAGEWKEFKLNFPEKVTLTEEQLANAPILTLRPASAGVFYIDDISWDNRSDYVSIGSVTTTAEAFVGDEYTLEAPTVSSNATLEIAVAAPDGSEVVPTEGKFTLEQVGNYVITYTAKGEVQEKSVTTTVTVSAKPSVEKPIDPSVKNSFENLDDCYIGVTNGLNATYFSQNSAETFADGVRSGAYSLKLNATKVDNYWFRPQVITGTTSLAEVGTLSFWVYNANDTAIGFSLYTVIVGTTNQTVNVYASIPAGEWKEFTLNFPEKVMYTADELANAPILTLRPASAGVFYIDDISWDTREQPTEDIKNGFENLDDCYIGVTNGLNATYFSQNSAETFADGVRSGDYSLKLNATSITEYWFRPQVVTGTTSLAEVGTLSFWVYNASDTAIGFSLYKIIVGSTNQVVDVYISIPAGEWKEFTLNFPEKVTYTADELANAPILTLRPASTGVFYIDDISWTERSN